MPKFPQIGVGVDLNETGCGIKGLRRMLRWRTTGNNDEKAPPGYWTAALLAWAAEFIRIRARDSEDK